MRKSFTRFLSLFVLFSIFSLFAVASIPTVTTVSPANGFTNVDPRGGSVTFTLTFDQNVLPGTQGAGVIALSNSSDVQLDPVQISGTNNINPVTGSTVVINGKVVTLTFKYSPIPEETTFYITATSDALKNAAGENWAGWRSFPGTHDYSFTTGDFTNPTVLAVSPFVPVDGSSANAINLIYSVTFNEPIQPGTGFIQTGDNVSKPGNIGIYKENGDVVEIYDVTTATSTVTPAEGAVGIVGNTLFVNPTDSKLVELGKYYVRVLNTAIVDKNIAPLVDNKNKFAGINNNTTWNFQLADLTPPTFAVAPANAATNIQQNAAMTMTFSDNRTAAGLLFELKSVTSTPPTVVANLAVGANVTSRVSFNEDPAGGVAFVPVAPGTWKATYSAANVITVEFISPAKFKTGAKYSLDVVANSLADVENNIVVSAPSTFKAGDFTVPYVVNTYAQPAGIAGAQIAPFNLNTTAADKETTKIFFGLESGDVDITSGLATLPTSVKYLVYLGTAAAPTAATVLASGTDLPVIASNTFKHQAFITTDAAGATLLSNTAYKIYYVVTDNATVKNSSALQTATVTTNDILAPTYTVTYMLGAVAQTATAVDKAGKIVITFNEDVASNTAGLLFTPATFASTFTLKQISPNVTLVNGTHFTVTKVSDKIFEINGTHSNWGSANWMSKGNYTLEFGSNKIYDLAGTAPLTGTANAAAVSTNLFTVKDYEGPTVVFAPANGVTGVNNNGDITITFSEAPYYLGAPVTQANIDALIELRVGDATTATTGSPLVPRTVTLTGNVVTITPTTKPLSSEIWYRASVSTDIADQNTWKLNKNSDNATAITVPASLEYSVFKTSDNRTPLVTYTTYVGTTAIPAAQDNVARVAQGLVNVDNAAFPVILLDETVQGIVGSTPIASMDPNQLRSLITLKKGDANGPNVEFNVLLASTNTSLMPPATGMFEIVLDPINYPVNPYLYDNSGTYYFSISGIQDAAKNPITGNATFNVINSTPLTLTGSTPGATGVAKSGNIVLTFNQNVIKTTTSGSFITSTNTGVPVGTNLNIDVTNAAVTVSGNQVTIPYSGFSANTSYTINVPVGVFTAVANNVGNVAITKTFTTVDEFGPTIDFGTAALPDESAPNTVAINNGQLSLTFSENIVLGNGYIKIRKPEAAGATTVADINVQSSSVIIDPTNANKVKISIPVALLYSQAYFVEIPQTAFKDAAGNNFQWMDSDHNNPVQPAPPAPPAYYTADVTAPSVFATPYLLGTSTWDFSTVNDALPTYTTFVPAAGSNDVASTAGLTINFSEPVTLATSGIRELTIYRASDNTTLETINLATAALVWNATYTQVTVQHLPFEANKAYYINISPSSFKDVTGNLIGAYTSAAASGWYFTTQDLTVPTAVLTTASGAALTAIPLADNLVLTFSEPIALAAGQTWATALGLTTTNGTAPNTFTATLDASKKVLTINPAVDFASLSNETLTINAGSIQDFALVPNVIAGSVITLKGEDKNAPVWWTSLVPVAYPVGVAPAYAKDKVKFQVALDEKAVVYYMTALGGSSTPTAAAVKAANIMYNYTASPFVANAVKTIEITGLNEYTTYDVYMIAEDLFGNQTIVKKVTLYTTDVTAPTLVSLYPVNGAVDVNYNHVSPLFNGINLKIRLSEKVAFTASTAKLVVRKYDTNVKVFDANRTGVGVDGTLAITSSSGALMDIVSVTIPKALLADKTQYYVEFEYDMVTDFRNGSIPAPFASGNNAYADAFIGKADWSFTTADETAPVLAAIAPATTTVPAFGAIDVPVAAPGTLTMRFSEPIAIGTGTIYIYRTGNATPQEVITLPNIDVVVNPANNKELLITRHNTFASELTYYVEFPSTGVKDLAPVPNFYAGIPASTWTFTTTDITSPAVVWSPVNNTTSVPTAFVVTAQFVDPRQTELTAATVYEPLYNSSALLANSDIKSWFNVTANGSSVALTSALYNGTAPATVTFTLTGGLKSNTSYVFNFNPPSTLTDDKGNLVPASSVAFSTVDNTSPMITFTPATAATIVPVGSYVTVKFNKTIYNSNMIVGGTSPNANFTPTAADFATGNYVTFKQGATNVPFTTEVVTPGVEYRLKPNAALASSTVYDVVWTATRGAVQEVYDRLALPTENKLDQTLLQRTTTFTTEDVVKPTVTALNPANIPTLTIVNPTAALVMTFSEKVQASTGNIQIRRGNGQIFHELAASACTYSTTAPWTVTIPHPAFEKFTTYYVIIPEGAITDASSNTNKFAGFADNTFWSFRTDDGTAPFVTLYTPENGSVNIPVFTNLTLLFSENIQANTGNIVIYYNNGDPGNDGNAVEIIPIGSSKVVISGSNSVQGLTSDIVTIDPSTTFDKLGTFYVRIDAGTVKDFAATANNYAGISNNTTWAFTVTDNTKPALVSTSPINGVINVASKPTLTMNFDKNVLAGTGSIKLFEYFYNPATFLIEEKLVEAIPVTSSQVVVNGMVVTVTPTVVLGDGKVYYVLVDNTALTNTASSKDPWAGISSPFVWRFTIGDNTAPTLTVTAPVAPVTKTFTVGLVFNEVVTGVNALAFTDLITGGTLNNVTGSGANYALSITAAEGAVVGIKVPNTIADGSGNKFAGVTLTYTVGDFTGPIVTADPATGLNMKGSFPVVLTFSADAVVTAADISVTGATTNVITNVGKVYTVAVTAADAASVVVSVAPTVKDNAGNLITGTTSFTYKVGDNTLPTLVITGPTAPIETAFILSFTFNEDVTNFNNAVTVENGVIKQVVGSGKNYFVSIVAAEKAAVKVTVSDAVIDANSNKFAGKTMTFNVGDFSAPTVVVTPPATPVTRVFSVGLKFNEPVNGLLFGGSAVTVTGGTLVDITGSGDTYTLVVSALEMTDVKIVLNNTIQDVSANKFAGLTLNYKTGDFTAPQLVAWTPTIADVLTDNHPKFKMILSENVKLGAGGNLVVYKLNTTTPALTIPITANMIFGKDVTVNYTTTSGLDKNTSYYVLVDATALTDNEGNAFAGVKDVAAWTFKTGANFATPNKPEIGSLEFKVYPNPFVEFVNVANASQLSKVVVTNIAGQVVKEVVNPTDIIQLNELRSGIYFMSLYNTEDIIVKTAKIVKR